MSDKPNTRDEAVRRLVGACRELVRVSEWCQTPLDRCGEAREVATALAAVDSALASQPQASEREDTAPRVASLNDHGFYVCRGPSPKVDYLHYGGRWANYCSMYFTTKDAAERVLSEAARPLPRPAVNVEAIRDVTETLRAYQCGYMVGGMCKQSADRLEAAISQPPQSTQLGNPTPRDEIAALIENMQYAIDGKLLLHAERVAGWLVIVKDLAARVISQPPDDPKPRPRVRPSPMPDGDDSAERVRVAEHSARIEIARLRAELAEACGLLSRWADLRIDEDLSYCTGLRNETRAIIAKHAPAKEPTT